MASYNKPGVYVEESLSPSTPISSQASQTNAVFVGVTDRGPTSTATGVVLGTPTVVTSLTDFANKFVFGSTVDMFASAVSTASADMRYALYSFFKNGGNQAVILRTPNIDASTASSTLFTQTYTSVVVPNIYATSVANAINVVGTTTNVATNAVVTLQGLTGTSAASFNKSWLVSGVTSTGFTLSATGVANTLAAYGTNVTLLISSTSTTSTTNALTIAAKDHGSWASKVWYSTQPSTTANCFDLFIYYSPTATNATTVTQPNVERWPTLNLDPGSSRYINKIVNSSWVNLSVTGTNTAALPMFTYYRNDSLVSTTPDGSLVAGPLQLGLTGSATTIVFTSIAGVDGSTAATVSTTTSRLDNIYGPMVINQPRAVDSTTINNLLSYSAARGDSFVVIDSVSADVTSAIATAAAYSTLNGSYGAVYFPQMVISDPATGGTQNRNVPAGAGVMAVYTSTDANRGIFKAPAGTAANFAPSTFVNSAYSLTNTDFDTVNNSNTAINVIRRLPGIGFCVMGARTLSTGFDDRYVPVRRTLGYLRKNLTDVTAQFVFEPNSSIIWSQISATIESFLYSFWRQGGLFGRTPTDAYYVKCDATTNNAAAQAAGELRVEVGVALQRPAEFVIIKLGQYQGGTSVTTSV